MTTSTNPAETPPKQQLLMPKRVLSPLSLFMMTKRDSSTYSPPSMNIVSPVDNDKKLKLQHFPEWNTTEEIAALPNIPFLHVPTQMSSVVIYEDDKTFQSPNPRKIANRIVDCVASSSSIGNYNDELATATIHTITNVKLSIHLYKHTTQSTHSSNKKNANTNESILIELQRLSGDTIHFHQAARVILDAARNKTKTRTFSSTTQDHGEGSRPSKIMKRPTFSRPSARRKLNLVKIQNKKHSSDDRRDCDALENIRILMGKDRLDAVRLGMETLAHLATITNEVAKAVLEGGIWQDIKSMIFSLVIDNEENSDDISSSEEHSKNDEEFKLSLALTIIANALSLYCQQKEQLFVSSNIELDELKDLMVALSKYMNEVERRSMENNNNVHLYVQNLYQAGRCIMFLLDLSEELKSFGAESKGLGLLECAERCRDGGICRHESLGQVTTKIVSSLQGPKAN